MQSEEDFYELYPEMPKMLTTPTFNTLILKYMNTRIKVKIPSSAPVQTVEYLFHKAIYNYLLNQSRIHRINPLLQTAIVIGFECVDNERKQKKQADAKSQLYSQIWYRYWLGKEFLRSHLVFECLFYRDKQEKLGKYRICGKIPEQQEQQESYLVRSLSDGRFYSMKRYSSEKIPSHAHIKFRNVLMKMNHPFIRKLRETYQTDQYLYFIFDHAVASLSELISQTTLISYEQLPTIFTELLLICQYLESNGISYENLTLQHLLICEEGHLLLSEQLFKNVEMKNGCNVTERRNKKKDAIVRICEQLISAAMTMSNLDEEETEILEQFLDFIKIAPVQDGHRMFLSFFKEHPLISADDTEKVLNKQLLSLPKSVSKIPSLEKCTLQFDDAQENYNDAFTFSDSRYLRPQTQRILQRYLQSVVIQKFFPLKKQSSNSLRIPHLNKQNNLKVQRNSINKENKQVYKERKSRNYVSHHLRHNEKTIKGLDVLRNPSPYEQIIRKQPYFKKVKNT